LSDWRVGAIYNPYEVPFTYDAPLTPVRQRVNGRTIAVSIIASGLVAATMLYRVLAMGGPLGGFENDQFVTLSQAQQIVMGDWPVRDFVALGKPLTLLLSAFGQVFLGRTLLAEAVLTSAFLGVCAAVLFVMGCRASGSIVIPLLVALMQIAMAPRFYNYPKLLAYAMAIPALWWYIDRPDRRRLAVLALVGVLAFLLRYDHGVYVGIAAILAVALAWRLDVRRMATDIALLGAMAFALVAPYLVFIQLNGGLVEHFQSFVRYATQTASRTAYRPVDMSLDWSQPFVTRVPTLRDGPRINVRWVPGMAPAQRAAREEALGLVEPEPIRADVVKYALLDSSPARLAAIVTDAAIADTSGIDRDTFVINDPFYTHVPTPGDRFVAFMTSVRILPGIFRPVNAAPFLLHLMYLIPLAALILVLAGGAGSATMAAGRPSTAKIVVLVVLTLLVERSFLRGNLPSRLADVSEPVGILACWVAAAMLLRSSRWGTWLAAGSLLAVFAASAASVEALENVSGQVRQSGIVTGEVRDRAAGVYTLLTAQPPVDAWPADTVGMEALARYVRSCTAPTDRVLAVGYIPELFFMASRQFAGGHVWIQPRFFNTAGHQALMIDRILSYRVPIAITVAEPEYTADYVKSFPALTNMLHREYQEAATEDFGRGFRFRILIRQGITPTRTYQPSHLPCFSS